MPGTLWEDKDALNSLDTELIRLTTLTSDWLGESQNFLGTASSTKVPESQFAGRLNREVGSNLENRLVMIGEMNYLDY